MPYLSIKAEQSLIWLMHQKIHVQHIITNSSDFVSWVLRPALGCCSSSTCYVFSPALGCVLFIHIISNHNILRPDKYNTSTIQTIECNEQSSALFNNLLSRRSLNWKIFAWLFKVRHQLYFFVSFALWKLTQTMSRFNENCKYASRLGFTKIETQLSYFMGLLFLYLSIWINSKPIVCDSSVVLTDNSD